MILFLFGTESLTNEKGWLVFFLFLLINFYCFLQSSCELGLGGGEGGLKVLEPLLVFAQLIVPKPSLRFTW